MSYMKTELFELKAELPEKRAGLGKGYLRKESKNLRKGLPKDKSHGRRK